MPQPAGWLVAAEAAARSPPFPVERTACDAGSRARKLGRDALRSRAMSIPVPVEKIRAAADERGGSAFLLTVTDDARPHAVHVTPRWEGEVLAVEVGKRSAENAAARAAVALLYPPRTPGDYSLIVDGTAVVEPRAGTRAVRITPTKAVLHRPAAVPDPSAACADDCVPLLAAPTPRERS